MFSYIGYRAAEVAVRDIQGELVVALEKYNYELRQVEVFNDNEALYDLVLAAGEHLRSATEHRSKVFFDLSTEVDSQQVEVVESYYNGRFEGPALKELTLKNGRIGVAPLGGQYFLNLNTTAAFASLDIRAKNPNFPTTPFALNKKQLFRTYDLQVVGMHSDGTNIYHLVFEPRSGVTGTFSGELWADGSGKRIDRITLSCSACTPQPFRPVQAGPSIEKVDMRYSIFFRQDAGGDRLAHIELTYDLSYRMGDQQTRKLHTVAILRPYDLGEPFFEPIFDTPYDRSDHCQITFLPYDSVFWSLNQGLVRTDRQEAALRFFADHGALVGHKDRSFTDVDDLLFDGLYTVWSSTSRITRSTIVRSEPPSPIQGNTLAENATQARSTKVDIEATIYLDAYEGPGGYSVRSATILDVFGSRYDLPMESGTNAFLNIWFDLCEIERRRMERDLGSGTLTEEKVRTAHAETMERIERTTLRFEKETSMGKNVEAMQSWNELVLRELGLNNLALFPMLD